MELIQPCVQKLYPEEGFANWSGIMMWRGTTKGSKFLSGKIYGNGGSTKSKVCCISNS